ncbi:MAG TPA: hypothetical protein PK487_05440 [bacterium]|nr:hypothetical protein [bacterium]
MSRRKILGVFGLPDIIWSRGETLGYYGINTVFIGHRNIDKDTVDRIHNEGAKVFVEVGIFAGKDTVERHPDLAPIGMDGNPLSPIDWYMGINPAIDWYREKKLLEIRDILENYNIDGLWLDFIRYPCHWEVLNPKLEQSSFDDVSVRKFEQYTGEDVRGGDVQDKARWILENKLDQWTRWKCSQISLFCRDVRDLITSLKKDALLGIFSVPWREDDFDDAIHKIIAQDFEELSLYVDVFSPMVYHLMCGFPAGWIREYPLYLKGKTEKTVIPIVQAVDEPRKVENLQEIIESVLNSSLDGVVVFTTRSIFEDKEKIRALKSIKEDLLQGVCS